MTLSCRARESRESITTTLSGCTGPCAGRSRYGFRALDLLGHGCSRPARTMIRETMTTILQTEQTPRGFVEKTALERYVPPAKPSLVGLSRAELADALGDDRRAGEAAQDARAAALALDLCARRHALRRTMTSVSKELRAALDERFTLERPEVVAEQVSVDGTRKWLLRLPGEHAGERPHEVECVYIPDTGRATLCVSSQVGCTLTCSFCHTGTQRLVRNLTPGEIVGQVMVARDRLGDWPGGTPPEGAIVPTDGGRFVTNIVMMGMGEPLYNFEAVRDALLDRRGRRRHRHLQAAHHALDLRRRAEHRARRRRRSAPCWRSRCTRCATSCATSWCRSTANIRSPNCSMPAATIRASRTRGASRSNT